MTLIGRIHTDSSLAKWNPLVITKQQRRASCSYADYPHVLLQLVNNAGYPEIAADYERMFRELKSLRCDIFLGAHGSYFDLESKYSRMKESGSAAFIDPEGYKNYVAEREQAFRAELAKQRAALTGGTHHQ
jgi:hypothetical protein